MNYVRLSTGFDRVEKALKTRFRAIEAGVELSDGQTLFYGKRRGERRLWIIPRDTQQPTTLAREARTSLRLEIVERLDALIDELTVAQVAHTAEIAAAGQRLHDLADWLEGS